MRWGPTSQLVTCTLCALDPADQDGLLGVPVPGSVHRFEEAPGLGETDRLADLTARLRQYLDPLDIDSIVLSDVRKFSQWKYKDAKGHIPVIASLMSAAHDLGLDFKTVKTDSIARPVKVLADKLATVDFTKFGYTERPMYWTAGMTAAHAAAAYALEVG